MKIIEKNIEELKEYDNNPRINDDAVQYVANSIKEFGFKQPVVIDSDGVIVAGHTRVKACRRLGIDKVPCVVADDLTQEQIKAYRLADNKTHDKALWDYEKLDVELSDLSGDFEMADFGFEDFSGFTDPKEPEAKTVDNATQGKAITCPECGFEFEV